MMAAGAMRSLTTPPRVEPVPAGMYELAGQLYIRRFAPVRPPHVVCRLGHRMHVRDRPLASTPQCDHHYRPGDQRCPAHLYLYRLTDLRYLALDVTREEADIIHRNRMDLDDVIAHFHLEIHPAT